MCEYTYTAIQPRSVSNCVELNDDHNFVISPGDGETIILLIDDGTIRPGLNPPPYYHSNNIKVSHQGMKVGFNHK